MAGNVQRVQDTMKNETGLGDIVEHYRDWAKDGHYDQDVTAAVHNGSIFAAEEMATLYPENKRTDLRILDVGAGTGRAAVELRQRGFQTLDGLDPCPEMLEIARKKELYQQYICAFVDEKKLPIEASTYDAVVSVGSISMNHLPALAIHEIVRILTTGGMFVMVGSAREWNRIPEYSVKMTNLIDELEKEGKISILKKTTRKNYMFEGTPECLDAIIYIIKKER